MLAICKQYADDVNLTILIVYEPIEYVSEVQLLSTKISTAIHDRDRHSYCRTNEVLFDFSSISCDIKSRLMSNIVDLYGSSLCY